MSLVVVLGATGAQGGSVVNRLVKNPKYKVRALTRNPDGDSAKLLSARGVEVAFADVDDVSSLVTAFKDASAIFAVTAFWPTAFIKGMQAAGEEELQQFKNIATAASQASTLKHLVLSTLPAADRMSGGRFKVPHFDYKQQGVQWIQQNHPKLWEKTTEFWAGFYTSNFISMMRFIPISGSSDAYLFAAPSKPESIIPIAGDLQKNCGIVVEGILDAEEKSHEKVAILVKDYLPIADVANVFAKVTGKRAAFAEYTNEAITKIFGELGHEIALQMRWSEAYPDWNQFEPDRVVSLSELGVEGQLVGFEQALEDIKDLIV